MILVDTSVWIDYFRAGVTVRKTIDVIIATFCIAEDLPLLHDDRDFDLIGAHLPLKTVR